MAAKAKCNCLSAPQLIVGLALLGWPRIVSATGTWSVIADTGKGLGQDLAPSAITVNAAGSLYVADGDWGDGAARIQKRDTQGMWSVIANTGGAVGQVNVVSGLVVDGADNLYVADTGNNRVQKYTPGP